MITTPVRIQNTFIIPEGMNTKQFKKWLTVNHIEFPARLRRTRKAGTLIRSREIKQGIREELIMKKLGLL